MNKLNSVLGILALLQTRPSVTLAEMVSHCKASERTVYRYLRTIQSVGIPIEFDRATDGYKLSGTNHAPQRAMRLDQTIVIGLALHLLALTLNPSQRALVEETWQRVAEGQSLLPKDVQDIIHNALAFVKDMPDMQHAANAVVIEVAALGRKPIQLSSAREGGSLVTRRLRQPSLQFSGSWLVRDLTADSAEQCRLDEVLNVRIE